MYAKYKIMEIMRILVLRICLWIYLIWNEDENLQYKIVKKGINFGNILSKKLLFTSAKGFHETSNKSTLNTRFFFILTLFLKQRHETMVIASFKDAHLNHHRNNKLHAYSKAKCVDNNLTKTSTVVMLCI